MMVVSELKTATVDADPLGEPSYKKTSMMSVEGGRRLRSAIAPDRAVALLFQRVTAALAAWVWRRDFSAASSHVLAKRWRSTYRATSAGSYITVRPIFT